MIVFQDLAMEWPPQFVPCRSSLLIAARDAAEARAQGLTFAQRIRAGYDLGGREALTYRVQALSDAELRELAAMEIDGMARHRAPGRSTRGLQAWARLTEDERAGYREWAPQSAARAARLGVSP